MNNTLKLAIIYIIGMAPVAAMCVLMIYAGTLPEEKGSECGTYIPPNNGTQTHERDCHKTWVVYVTGRGPLALLSICSVIAAACLTVLGMQIGYPDGKINRLIKRVFSKIRSNRSKLDETSHELQENQDVQQFAAV
jgi:hypothetical protein